MGYILTYRNGILSLRKEPYKRNIRIIRTFGEKYSRDMIISRIQNTTAVRIPFPEAQSLIGRYKSKYKIKTKGIIALYWYYHYLLKITPPNKYPPKLSKFMREEIKIMNAFSNEIRFTVKNGLHTLEELEKFKDNSVIKLNKLKGTRENLWRKYNKTPDTDKKDFIYSQIQKLAIEIKEIGIDIKMCKSISKRYLKANEVISKMNNSKEVQRTIEKRNRDSR